MQPKDQRLDAITHLRIERELGRGGTAIVYLAEDLILGRQVAIRVTPPTSAANAKQLLEEARLMSSLSSPHIATIHQVHRLPDDTIAVEMEFLAGGDLQDRLEPRTPLGAEEVPLIGSALASALVAAHEGGLLHGDLKPANVIFTQDGSAKLCDFRVTRGAGMGVPAYTAPEVLMGSDPQPASDIWSLGVILFRLTTGHLPFTSEHLPALFSAILNQSPPQSVVVSEVEHVRELALTCLAKDPEERPTAGEIARALRSALRPTSGPPPHLQGAGTNTALLGREAELEALRTESVQFQERGMSVWTIAGAAGVGKSALMRAFLAETNTERLAQLIIELTSGSSLIESLAGAIAEIAATERVDLPAGVLGALRGTSDSEEGVDPPRGQPLTRMTEHVERALRAMTRVAPICVVVEDIHDVDPGELRLLRTVLSRLRYAPLWCLVTLRVGAEAAGAPVDLSAFEREGALPADRILRLEGVDREAGYSIIRQHLGRAPDAELAGRVLELAGGNPLLIQELAAHGTGILTEDGLGSIPDSLARTTVHALRALPGEVREVLQIAAMGGAELNPESVSIIAGKPLLSTLRTLQRLSGLGLPLRATPTGFAFQHGLLREATVNATPSRRRHELHAAWATLLLAQPDSPSLAIAEHLEAAGQPEDARLHYIEAARVASLRQQVLLSIRLLEKADLRPPKLDAKHAYTFREVLLEAVHAFHGAGEHEEFAEVLELVAAGAKEAGDDRVPLQCAVTRAYHDYFREGATAIDESLLLRACQLLKGTPSASRAAYTLGMVEKIRGNFDAARQMLEEANASAVQLRLGSIQTMALDQLASLALRTDQPERAAAMYLEAAEVAEDAGCLGGAAIRRVNRALALYGTGRADGIVEDVEAAADVLELEQMIGQSAHARTIAAQLQWELGDGEGSRGLVERAIPSLERCEFLPALLSAYLLSAEHAIASCEPDRAMHWLDRAAETAGTVKEASGAVDVEAQRILALSLRGDHAAAEQHALDVLSQAEGELQSNAMRSGFAHVATVAMGLLHPLPTEEIEAVMRGLLTRHKPESEESRTAVSRCRAILALRDPTSTPDGLERIATALHSTPAGAAQVWNRVLHHWVMAERSWRVFDRKGAEVGLERAREVTTAWGHLPILMSLDAFGAARGFSTAGSPSSDADKLLRAHWQPGDTDV